MYQSIISVWFVCRLCRGSFGQVDAFIEHKKQKHFTQFQNTTCIVFEERDLGPLYPVIFNEDHQLADESNEPPIKIEGYSVDPNPMSSEIIEEPNVNLVEPKSELITYESGINPENENENSFCGLKKPEQNPYVLLKRLTSEEIQPTVTVKHLHTEPDYRFQCKLCTKQLESEAQLKIHVGICALYHEDRNRFCVKCNRKFSYTKNLKSHRLTFHGTEEEKLSLYKFKCHVCPKQYQNAVDLTFHLKSHKETNGQVETSKSKLLKCSQPTCVKEFRSNSQLQRHLVAHFGLRPFSCHFPNCNKNFSQRIHLNVHLRIHTRERPYKCTVENCNEAFISSHKRSVHYRKVHSNL